jgi:Transposase, Mutator family
MRLAVVMLDGMQDPERTHVVALAITTEDVKLPLGLWEASTQNATLARTLLADLVDRGLDPTQAIQLVIDGGKALRRAIGDVFGEHALVHRCHRHKERNLTDLCPMKQCRTPNNHVASFRSTQCDPFGIPSTSPWTGAAIIVQSPRTKTCIVTRLRTSTRPMRCSLAG